MAKTYILSQDTLCSLLEAHASLAAWYYQLTNALRDAEGNAQAPDEQQRLAFLSQLASQYPELAEAAQSIAQPRPYDPPPTVTVPSELAIDTTDQQVAEQAPPDDKVEQTAQTPPPPPTAPHPGPIGTKPSAGSPDGL